MLGFFPFSAAPISSTELSSVGPIVIQLSISEDILQVYEEYLNPTDFKAAIAEPVVVDDIRASGFVTGFSIIEGISNIGSSFAATSGFAVSVAEYMVLADIPVPVTRFNISRTEGLQILSVAYVLKGWSDVIDTDAASWDSVQNINVSGWTSINDTQSSTWTPIDNTRLF